MASVGVIGTGYVGLTTGTVLAHLGHHVVCADVDRAKVEMLRRAQIPIYEAGLQEMVQAGLDSGRLEFVLGGENAARHAEFVFLCVPTPQAPDGRADLSYIQSAAEEIAGVVQSNTVVINKSTVPVGSTLAVEQALGRSDVYVVSNPEFLREGSAVHDSLNPDRIVIGSEDQAAALRVATLYSELKAPVIITDPASAETIKYACNAFLATKISFINAIANLCEAVGADVRDVVVGMGYDQRIGFEFLRPGPGWGGSCFPKDTRALLWIAEENGYSFDLLAGVIDVNEEQFDRTAAKVARAAGGDLEGKTVGVWGLTFKARTDDTRQSPALAIIERLQAMGAKVRAYDPQAHTEVEGVVRCKDAYSACEGAEVLAVLTEWDEFRWVDWHKVADQMAGRAVVDARNLLNAAAVRRNGFTYIGVGVP
ncbi:MAG: UDP-glucose/GDP-mannose dehydrogenase family protein [Actinobacteria bacterium]|nr:UDP-glucose/GDP-mannose dehydrogenase family protein [Actinomycetota bacterium]